MAGLEGAARLQAVNHLTYNVTDKARALRFWEDVLGTRQIPSQVDLDHIIWLQLPSGTMVHLIENPESPSVPSHHGAFEVDDVDAAATALREVLAAYEKQRDLILLGAYEYGSDDATDYAIDRIEEVETYLRQAVDESQDLSISRDALVQLFSDRI